MDEKFSEKHRSKLKKNGLGGAQNTPNSMMEHHVNGEASATPSTTGMNRGVKRKHETNVQEEPSPRPKSAKKEMVKGKDLVDRIWLEIDNQQREKRDKKALRKAAADMVRGTSSNATDSIPAFTLELTASNLKSQQQDDLIPKEFVNRETMVDRLLGYKMLLGRMENCGVLGFKKIAPPRNAEELNKAQKEGAYIPTPFPYPEHCPSRLFTRPPKGPRTPPLPTSPIEIKPILAKKGPKTPPGSPGPSTPPPPPPMMGGHDMSDRQRLLVHMANVTGTTVQQVEMFLGDDLSKAIDNFGNKTELLESLKSALQSLGSSGNGGNLGHHTPVKIQPQPITTPARRISGRLSDQMELVSDASLSDCGAIDSKATVLLAAPPLPPPLNAPPVPQIPAFSPMMQLPPPSMLPMALPSMSVPPPLSHPMNQPPPPMMQPVVMPNYNYHQQPQAPPPPPTHLPPPPLLSHQPPPPPNIAMPMPMLNVPPPPINAYVPPPPPSQAPPPPPPQHGYAMNVPPPPIGTPQVVVKKPIVELKSIVDVNVADMKKQMNDAAKAAQSQQNANSWRQAPAPPPDNSSASRLAKVGTPSTPAQPPPPPPPTSSSAVLPPSSSSGPAGASGPSGPPTAGNVSSHNVQFTLFSALGFGGNVPATPPPIPRTVVTASTTPATPVMPSQEQNRNPRNYQNYQNNNNNNNRQNNFRRGGFRGGGYKYQNRKKY